MRLLHEASVVSDGEDLIGEVAVLFKLVIFLESDWIAVEEVAPVNLYAIIGVSPWDLPRGFSPSCFRNCGRAGGGALTEWILDGLLTLG